MEEKQPNGKKEQQPKILKFLSEYQSQSSELRNNKFRNIPSAKTMKRLKQLWNRQKFLTDDECQSSIDPGGSAYLEDSSMNHEVDDVIPQVHHQKQYKKGSSRTKEQIYLKSLHRRQVSSSDERMSLPQKMKKKRQGRSENKNKAKQQCSIKDQLSQIEAFNSAIQDFSSS